MDYNRRRHTRIPITILCDLLVPEMRILRGRGCIINFSVGGVAIESTLDVPIGTEILMVIDFYHIKMDIPGRVSYSNRVMGNMFVYGVKFAGFNIFKRFKLIREFKRYLQDQ